MLEQRKYLGMTVTYQNYIHEEVPTLISRLYVFPSPVQNTNVKGYIPKCYWTRFEILTAILMEIQVICHVTPCGLVNPNQWTRCNIPEHISLKIGFVCLYMGRRRKTTKKLIRNNWRLDVGLKPGSSECVPEVLPTSRRLPLLIKILAGLTQLKGLTDHMFLLVFFLTISEHSGCSMHHLL
jgi:hypothetical protein